MSQRGQSIFELALLIGVVVTALLVMQTYVRRTVQDRIRDAVRSQPSTKALPGGPLQYEPYYLEAPNPNQLVSRANVSVQTFGDYRATPAGMTGNLLTRTTRRPGSFQEEHAPGP